MSPVELERIQIEGPRYFVDDTTLAPFRSEYWTVDATNPSAATLHLDAGITFTVKLSAELLAQSAVAAAALDGLKKVADGFLNEAGKSLLSAVKSGYYGVKERFRKDAQQRDKKRYHAVNYFVGTNHGDTSISIQLTNNVAPSFSDETRTLAQLDALLATFALLNDARGTVAARLECRVGDEQEWTGMIGHPGREPLVYVDLARDWTNERARVGDEESYRLLEAVLAAVRAKYEQTGCEP